MKCFVCAQARLSFVLKHVTVRKLMKKAKLTIKTCLEILYYIIIIIITIILFIATTIVRVVVLVYAAVSKI